MSLKENSPQGLLGSSPNWSICDFAFCNSKAMEQTGSIQNSSPQMCEITFIHPCSRATVARDHECPPRTGRSRTTLLEPPQGTVQERPLLAILLPLGAPGLLQKLLLGFLLNELPSRRTALTSPEACGLLDEEANT